MPHWNDRKNAKSSAVKKGYHGVTIAAASMTALAYAQDGFGLPLDFVKHTTAPDYYNGAHAGESEEEFSSRCAVLN